MIRSTVFAIAIAVLAPTAAQAEPAKPETVEELLAVTRAQSMIESVYQSMDNTMQTNLGQAMAQMPGDAAEKQAYVDSVSRKMVGIMREELNWDTLKPMYLRIYGESFSQEELVGLLDFYKTPAGQAAISKMPLVMQKTMAELQQRMGALMQRFGQAAQQAIDEAKARHAAKQPANDAATPTGKPTGK